MTEAEGCISDKLSEIRRELLSSTLDLPLIYRLGKRLNALAHSITDRAPANVRVHRIAIVSSLTSDFLAGAICCAVAQEGDIALIYQAPFGTYQQEILDHTSQLRKFRPDVVAVVPDWRTEVEQFELGTLAEAVRETCSAKVRQFELLWQTVSSDIGARVIQHTLVPPNWELCGSAERLWPGSFENQVTTLNRDLFEAGRGRVTWLSLDHLAARVGLDNWFDEGAYFKAKLPFRLTHLVDYVTAFRAAWRSVNGRSKKVLILDLDNTLWGGVIGDVGVEGIVLGPGSATGEAFLRWGQYLKLLHARGVILAVCSKNDPKIAATAFCHQYIPLRKTDFAAFECSWGDKASGIARIAQTIGVALDSLVLADDNPAECEQVRLSLPSVEVVPLGAEPSRFITLIERWNWFDAAQYTNEDLTRGAAYTARASAKEIENSSADISVFLTNLRMTGTIWSAGTNDLARLAQLEQKTNQFNLTTRRYAQDQLAKFGDRRDSFVLCFRLADKFGDHGLVSSLVAVLEGDTLRIDSWLMSCRIFSRTAEAFIMRNLVERAKALGARRVLGEYLPTERNTVVADLYRRLGFERYDELGAFWVLNIETESCMLPLKTWIHA